MGRNKNLRKAIAGHERNISKHHLKIQNERKKDLPNELRIDKWARDIQRAEERIKLLNRRIERGRNNASR